MDDERERMFSVDGKVAVVTGGASGIGAATAARLARAGARVIVGDLVPDGDARRGESLRFVPADVSKERDVAALLRAAVEEWGRLDVLVSNAGVGTTELLAEITEEALARNFDVNVKGVVWGLKHAPPLMDRGGAIINLGSVAAAYSLAGYGAYSASKAAVLSLTRTAAIELADQGVRVNAVCPNAVDTPMLYEPGTELERAIVSAVTPLRRVADPEEIAAVVHFLASDEGAYLTGEALYVDGGVRAGPAFGITEAVHAPGVDVAGVSGDDR